MKLAALLAAVLLAGCASSALAPAATAHTVTKPVYDYLALDGKRFDSESNRGKVAVIVVIATYDLGSQVVMRELSEVRARQHRGISMLALALEPPKNAPLAEAFAATLDLPFPIAMADQATLEGDGPFGAIGTVPTTIVLAPGGTEVWRHEGAVLAAELEREIAKAREMR
jgi:hypothetical protein